MYRSIAIAAVMALLASSAWAQEAKKAKGPLDGTWLLVGMNQGGQEVPEEHLPLGVVRFKGDHATVVMWDLQCKATLKIDADAKPGTIDVTHVEGTHEGEKQYAVFALDGDELIICGAAPGAAPESRPKSIDSTDERHLRMTFRRIELKAKGQVS